MTDAFPRGGAQGAAPDLAEWLGTAFDQLHPRLVIGVGLVGLIVGANGAPLRQRLAAGCLGLIGRPRVVAS